MSTSRLNRAPLQTAFLALLVILPSLLCPTTSRGAAGTIIAWGDNTSGQTNVPPDLTNAVAVAAGASQSLAIRQDGTVSGWGGSSAALTNLPAGLSNVVQVAGGGTHSLALRADGSVVGWGDNFYPDTNSPTGQATPPAGLANAVGIAAGWAHSMAVRSDGTVVAWGYNGSGQTNVPANLGPVMAVAAGDWFSAALRKDGTVAVWGTNNVGQTNVPAGLSNVVALSARGATVLALKQNGRVVAWGGGSLGQTNVPADLTNAVAIAAGTGFELALRDDGRVTAWGDNSAGQLDGAAGLAQVVGLAAGGAHGLALLGDGTPQFTLQPRNQSAFAGSNVTFAAKAAGDPPLSYQWLKDGLSLTDTANLSGSATPTLTLTNIAGSDSGAYSLVVSNTSGSVTSAVATLTLLTPALADAFNTSVTGSNPYVYSLAVQPDGKILLGGYFFSLNGQASGCLGRANLDGSLDTAFNPGAGGTTIPLLETIALLPDGRFLVGGDFLTLSGQTRNHLGRFNADGSLDVTFNPGTIGTVYALAVQADGKIVVGGSFTSLGGQSRTYLGRLNADGSLDSAFTPSPLNIVYALALQPDGKILFGGANLGRLNPDGTLDTSFNPARSGFVYAFAVQADGKILLGGSFSLLGGPTRSNLCRLNADGSLDPAFNPVANNTVYSLVAQADGRILVAGNFTALGGQTRNRIGRLNADGSLDTTFDPGASGTANPAVYGLALQADGKVLAGGLFTTLGGQTRNCLGRLTNTEPATQSLNFDGSTVTWLRGGTAPEFWRTTFECSTNGTDWLSLGAGTRVMGGWQQTGLSQPTNATIRARGYCAGGWYNSSSGFLETSIGPPAISIQPANVANLTNTAMSLSVVAAGTAPLAYQWYRNGAAVANATNSAFGIQQSAPGDAGNYQVVVANGFGSITSAVATLKILNKPVADALNPLANNTVYAVTTQPDGKLLVGGAFTALTGTNRSYVGRLNADGSLDTYFLPALNNTVYCLAAQTDGKVLLGGIFTTLGGQTRNNIGRLNADGSLDYALNPGAGGSVYALGLQADGKIVVGGTFTFLGGVSRSYLGRLNADGSLDTNFTSGANRDVFSLAVQADGKILVGGTFTTLAGYGRSYLGRLMADGTLDTGFNPGANGSVAALAVQADGKIWVGGSFTTLGGLPHGYLSRLSADGSVDAIYPEANGAVNSLVVQADGKILVGGTFTTLNGQTRNSIGRLNADGSLDTTFNPTISNSGSTTVYALAVQKDGDILVGGNFNSLGAQPRSYLGRLTNTEPATESLNFDGSTATWLRGATSPEVWRMTLDASTNGTDWISLGAARIPGGWQQTGLALRTNATIRARGFFAGGQYNGSGSWLETSIGPPAISSLPVSTGNFTNTPTVLSVSAAGTPPLACQWYKNGIAIAGATNTAFTVQSSAFSDAGSYQLVVTNGFGSVTSAVAILTILTPAVADSFNPAATAAVYPIAVQPDGKVLAGGDFLSLGGKTSYYVGRLNSDGSLDPSFGPPLAGSVYALAVQTDGKILVGGGFTTVGGLTFNHIARFNTDGRWDVGFNPGANNYVGSLAVQPDGKILVGGGFTTLGGQTRYFIGRLNPDGSLDAAFNPGAGGWVYSVALQADGKILVGGGFTTLGGQTRNFIGRLNADGSLDATFNPVANGAVLSLAVQADGKILVAGGFTTLGGTNRNYLGRLNADGSLDPSFNPGAGAKVVSIAVQTDGKIIVGGDFTTLGGQTRNRIGRLNADGTLDNTFNPAASSSVYSLTVQRDGKILVGGAFATLGGQTRNNLGRLNNTQPATESLAFDNSSITWLRGGTGPEAWTTTFDVSTNGANWTNVGAGTRIPGGWQQTGLALPTNTTIRARAFFVAGGKYGSSWFLETFVGAPFFASQPANAANYTNVAVGFSVTTVGTPPFAYQWYKNGATIAAATNSAFTLPSAALSDVAGYQVVVSNGYGSVTSVVATLKILNPPVPDSFNPGANSDVYTIAVQPDGKVLVGGYFTNLAGQSRSRLGRLNADGSLDTAFNPGADNIVNSLGLQPNGKILVAGSFTHLAGQPRNCVGRLNPDGSLDLSFNSQANSTVFCLAAQADGRILVGGSFTILAGQTRNRIGRLNADGSLDSAFNPGADSLVTSLALQADGRILAGGAFGALGGQPRSCIGRLEADGSLDTTFDPWAGQPIYSWTGQTVYVIAVQADGKIIVGGTFQALGGQYHSGLGRLNADGIVDASYNPNTGPSVQMLSLAVQTDGKVVVGGYFSSLGRGLQYFMGRLNTDGTVDPFLNPNPYGTVDSLALQADGKILVGGDFTTLGGLARTYIGRLSNTEPATDNLTCDGSTITWLRGATGPEAWRTTFEASTNGADWISLGAGTRIAGGWQQTGLSLPTNATIRARGFVVGGQYNGSSWFVETTLGPVAVSQQPASCTNNAGAIAQFIALGAGTAPLGYQWCKGGVALSDGGNISGAQTGSLTLTNLLKADEGGYSVIITNSSGSVTSLVATLSVVDPFISTQPVSQAVNAGATVVFSATVPGTAPLAYQWRRNGVNLAGATSLSLTLTNVQWADAAGFDLLVTNTFGAVTSAVAVLSVNGPVILTRDGNFGLHTNKFGFNVGCMPGQAVVIEASTNLANWVAVQTNLVTSEGLYVYVDRDKGSFPRRFYRARPYVGTLPGPTLDPGAGSLGFQSNRFGFNLYGVAGQTAVVQISSNLLTWTPLSTNLLGLDPLYVSDAASTNWPQRFYRAVLAP